MIKIISDLGWQQEDWTGNYDYILKLNKHNAKNWAILYLYYVKLSHATGTLNTPIICENIEHFKIERTSSKLYTSTESYTMDNEVG